MNAWLVLGALAAGIIAVLGNRNIIAWLQSTLEARCSASTTRRPPRPSTRYTPGAGIAPDVVIVLGYALFRNGSLTEPLKGRVWHGVQAWEQLPRSKLIFSGSHPGDGLRSRTEASAMEQYALQVHNVQEAPNTWLLEQQSTSTRENAMYSLAIAKAQGLTNVLVVTNTFHQLRSYLVFVKAAQELGVQSQVQMAPLPFIGHKGWGGGPMLDTAMDHVDFWREIAALAYYKLRGFI